MEKTDVGKAPVRALFLDVDGTLVSFETHRVSDATREALIEAHRRGVKLFVATGRTASNLAPLAGLPFDGAVLLNGASCLAGDGSVVSRHPIPEADFERIMAFSEELGFPVVLEMEEGLFADRLSPEIEEMVRMVELGIPLQVTDIRAKFAEGGCCQLCLFFDAGTERRVMEHLPGLVAARWFPTFADINVRGVDKATGMAGFADRFGFSLRETMAFGDGGNDVQMLRAAGIGVAMGNACEEARAAADWVTSSVDEEGIVRALVHFGVIGPR